MSSWASGMIGPSRPERAYMGKPVKRTDKNGKSRWMARVYDPTSRKKISVGTFATKGEAQEAINQFYARPRPGRNETCDSFAGRWVDDYPRPSGSTNKHNRERVQKFSRDFRGVKMHDVTRPIARAWALENPSCLGAVRAMFNDALDDELVIRNPFASLRLPKSKGRRDFAKLTEDQVQHLADKALETFPGVAGQTVRAMILFAAYTGVREGELFALKRSDLGHDEFTVRQSFSSKTGTFGRPKNGQERTIVLPPQARQALAQMPAQATGEPYVFLNPRDGHHFTISSHGYYWRQIRAAAGMPKLTWHELRHGCATILRRMGVPPHMVAHQLGHTDGGALVMKLYGRPEEELSREAIKAAWGENVTPLRAVSDRGRR